MTEVGRFLYDFENCVFGGGSLCVAAAVPLFSLSLMDKTGKKAVLDGRDAFFRGVDSESGLITAGYIFECGIEIKLIISTEKDRTVFGIDVNNHTDAKIEWVEYAPLCVPKLLEKDGGVGKILWPLNEGIIVSRYADREDSFLRYQEPEYPSQGCFGVYPNMVESQFISYIAGGNGIYIGAHDESCGTKSIDFLQLEDCIYIRIRAFTDCDFGENYSSDYDTAAEFFEGDWMDAADIYYEWFSNTVGRKFKKIYVDDSLPTWYKDAPVVVAYPVRGHHDTDTMTPNRLFPYTEGLKVIDELSAATDSRVMALLMHWEGTAPWAPPYVWPPFGGEEEFSRFADKLHASGNLLGVYCSGLGWTQESKLTDYNCEDEFERKNLRRIMCAAPDGSLPLSKICTAQRSGYDLCPACKETKSIIQEEVKKITTAGVDYIQVLDQNHGGCGYFCYSAEHGHNPGPGKWQAKEMRELLKPLAGSKRPLLGCESAAADCFLDKLRFSDNRYELNHYAGECVPLYAYLYHEYLYNFMGNQVCLLLESTPTNYLYRLAYSFVAGDAPTIVINDAGDVVQHWGQISFDVLPDRRSSLELIKNVNAWRRGFSSKFLCGGKMIRPIELKCETQNIPVCSVRDDIVAGKVMYSRWRASDGTTAQIVVNYTTKPCKIGFDGSLKVWTDPLDENNSRVLQSDFIVPALSAVLVDRE